MQRRKSCGVIGAETRRGSVPQAPLALAQPQLATKLKSAPSGLLVKQSRRYSACATGVDGDVSSLPVDAFQARSNSQSAEKEQATDRLESAVFGEDIGELLSAIGQARVARVQKESIDDATKLLQRLQVSESLDVAVKNNNLDALKLAVTKAKQAGVPFGEVNRAEDLAKELECRNMIRDALEARSVSLLQTAVAQGKKLCINDRIMDDAQTYLAQTEARMALQTSIRKRNIVQLQAAVGRATQAGILAEDKDMQAARTCLGASSKHQQRRESVPQQTSVADEAYQLLQGAIADKETGGLRMAIDHAQAVGFSGEALTVATAVLEEILEKRARARQLKRVER